MGDKEFSKIGIEGYASLSKTNLDRRDSIKKNSIRNIRFKERSYLAHNQTKSIKQI